MSCFIKSTIKRRITKTIYVGNVPIGGGHPIVVQSMTNTDTRDVHTTRLQIEGLVRAGCEIVRVAVPDMDAAKALSQIVLASSVPVIADVHFDWRLAVEALRQGVHGIRINPGNIGGKEKLKRVVDVARDLEVPIRVGVNAGSLEADIRKKYHGATPEALVESALRNVERVAELGHGLIKISIKSSDCLTTVAAYRLICQQTDFPLHLGVTEAGGLIPGTVKNSVALGVLLMDGIGDTIRVSLTRPPEEEVRVAYEILKSLGIRKRGAEIISCPTCGRCEIDLFSLAEEVERRVVGICEPVTIAVMGCVVNGPGEAREADVGIAGGKGVGIIFKHGKILKKVREERLMDEFWEEVESVIEEKRGGER